MPSIHRLRLIDFGIVFPTDVPGLLNEARTKYKHFKTKSGRNILEPSDNLKSVQREIASALNVYYQTHDCAHAYRTNKGVKSAVKVHYDQPTVVAIDIRTFFESIPRWKILDVLINGNDLRQEPLLLDPSSKIMSEDDANVIADLCTYNGSLPIGAPSSPVLSNIIMRRFDRTLFKILCSKSISYTRYADDIIISGYQAHRQINLVYKMLKQEGFEPNVRKTRIMHKKNQQKVFGIILNRYNDIKYTTKNTYGVKLRIPRKDRRKLRARRHHLKLHQLNAHRESGLLDYRTDIDPRVLCGQESWEAYIASKQHLTWDLATRSRLRMWSKLKQ